jgi:alpha-N-arabinofuranosidase
VSATASLAADGAVTVTLCNTDSEKSADVALELAGRAPAKPTAQVIAARKLTACNTFDRPQAVVAKRLTALTVKGKSVRATLPPGSVAALRFA